MRTITTSASGMPSKECIKQGKVIGELHNEAQNR